MASSEIVRIRPFASLNFSRKEFTNMGMSVFRSRSGGILICTTFNRKKRSCLKVPCLTDASRSRFVAEMMRAESGIRSVEPTGRTSFSCSARSSLACISNGKSPISSRNKVPPSAISINPCFACSAPVSAPFTQPNNCASINVGTSDEQSTGRNGLFRRTPE
jgi:hypothetical protein